MSNDPRAFLGNIDRRTREARRCLDVYDGLIRHLGGDDAAVSEPRLHLAKRAAALVTWCEVEESKLVLPQAEGSAPFDPTTYGAAVNSLRRLLLDLNLNPTMRDVTPDLAAFLSIMANGADDAGVIDAETVPPEPPEPVRRDSRGRILKGTPEEVERAKHMRETAKRRKAEKAAEQMAALRAAVKQVKQTVRYDDTAPGPRPSHRAAKLPPQKVKREPY